MTPKQSALLGFARKAKKLVSGEAACEVVLKKGQARLVILAKDVSPNLHKRYSLWCQDEGVPLILAGDKVSLGTALGLSPRTVIALTDENFARSILAARGNDRKN